ncbi:MAG: hypothetical protein JNK48_30640 [Bryobacterales bacterium]|nr:hypothetical protein [Bryobacterales bacterium]
MRRDFARVHGEDFDILGDAARALDGVPYWVVALRPRRAGVFFFRHFCDSAIGYRHRDFEGRILVLDKGAPRALRYDLHPQTVCVGDTLLVPFADGSEMSNHRFAKQSRFPQYFDGPFAAEIDSSPIASPPNGPVEYLGRSVHYMVHRIATRASVTFHAYFGARTVGSCNLRIEAESQKQPPVTLAVEVLSAADHVRAVLAAVSTHAFDHPDAVSTGWLRFPASPLSLRPGDRFSIAHGRLTVPNNEASRRHSKHALPRISLLPYHVPADAGGNAWLASAAPSH